MSKKELVTKGKFSQLGLYNSGYWNPVRRIYDPSSGIFFFKIQNLRWQIELIRSMVLFLSRRAISCGPITGSCPLWTMACMHQEVPPALSSYKKCARTRLGPFTSKIISHLLKVNIKQLKLFFIFLSFEKLTVIFISQVWPENFHKCRVLKLILIFSSFFFQNCPL